MTHRAITVSVAVLGLASVLPAQALEGGLFQPEGGWLQNAPAGSAFDMHAPLRLDTRVDALDATLFDGEHLELGLLSRQRSGLYDPPSHRRIDTDVGLFTLGKLGGARLGARWSTRVAADRPSMFEGLRGDLLAGYVAEVHDRLDLSFGLGTTWTDADYWNAPSSGFGADAAGSGFRDASLQIGACYRLASDWSLGARVGYRRYMDAPRTGVEHGDLVTGIQLSYRLDTAARPTASGLFGAACAPY